MLKGSPHDARIINVEPMPPNEAKWIHLKKISYKDPSGKSRTWESAERQTRPKSTDCDAIGIIAILHDPSSGTGPSLLLQKQFRPPINKVTIEVPSGLVDADESITTAAIRELKEETGYVGTVPQNDSKSAIEGFIMHNDPGFCNTNTKMVFIDVDMANPKNQKEGLEPELEDSEFIECFTIPLANLWDELCKLDQEGYAIDARVGTLAQGMEVAKKWKGLF